MRTSICGASRNSWLGREADTPYVYKPHADAGESYRWDAAAKAGMKDYNLLDLSI